MTGVGKGRVLALGLPLLQVLTIAEFRAILAHEFAHFYSGDTRLAPWVYKARSTMVRVFQNLNKKSEVISVLTRFAIIALVHMVLMGGLTLYWKFFIWITQLISRRQEYRCDELACHIAGSDALIEALRKLRKSAAILGPYWSTIVLPIASSGYQPQIADGFARFLAAPQNEKTASDVLEKEISSTKSNTLDTHPPLSKRIVRARSIGIAMTQDDVRPAVSLIDHLGPLEADLLRRMIPALKTTELKPMSWETAGVDVYVPLWRKQIAGCLPLFLNETLATFPELIVGSRPLADKILNPPGMLLNSTQREDRAMGLLVPALALSLYEKGWALHIQPGAFYLDH
jgi:heat shock protein HtpX